MAITQTNATDENASIDDLSKRDIAALTSHMTTMTNVGDVEPPEYEVTTDSGSAYVVDIDAETCTCPDHEHRQPDGGCKHVRRVAYATGARAVPAWVNLDTVDDQLGEHVTEGSPRVAMADGGAVAQREPISETADDLAATVGHVIGVDGTGSVHAHYSAADEVRVYDVSGGYEVGDRLDEGDVEHTQDLGGRPLAEWMGYVAQQRGWETTTHRAPDGFDGDEEVSA